MQRSTRTIVLFSLLGAVGVVVWAAFYYHRINSTEDPRVVQYKQDLHTFDEVLRKRDFVAALDLLNAIERGYKKVPGYENSFEIGVIDANRASVYLIQAEEILLKEEPEDAFLQSLVADATAWAQKSVQVYQSWKEQMESENDEELFQRVAGSFDPQDPLLRETSLPSLIEKRVADLKLALQELPRRQSVACTNLALAYRYGGQPEKAMELYQQAIKLWAENDTASNNLRVLQGKERVEQGFLRKLFPETRQKGLDE